MMTQGTVRVQPAQALDPGHLHPPSLPQGLEPWAPLRLFPHLQMGTSAIMSLSDFDECIHSKGWTQAQAP